MERRKGQNNFMGNLLMGRVPVPCRVAKLMGKLNFRWAKKRDDMDNSHPIPNGNYMGRFPFHVQL